jgi:hypothetical protein
MKGARRPFCAAPSLGDHDQTEVDQQKGFTNALVTHLTPFTTHGGKLIMFHGFATALISP